MSLSRSRCEKASRILSAPSLVGRVRHRLSSWQVFRPQLMCVMTCAFVKLVGIATKSSVPDGRESHTLNISSTASWSKTPRDGTRRAFAGPMLMLLVA
eukprot:CAMPEP_0172775698 /NCGR_PEP_ID=MMETSP1074-20121228/198440_1 /TAXON_ID=2916 /ORGANISM="Ceratium fusus, Strain PA161109" /LENGTH=97 /DNA_ID=CAMNT_0013612347 /DNA_START=80 /DNA_END=370 /DNA_ORIENTATION=-